MSAAGADLSLEKQQKLEQATRYDAGKIPYHLFPLDAFEEICKVMQFGAKKYAERNWEQGMSWSRVARSMFSHFIAICRGEQNDPESNLPHAAHMAWMPVARAGTPATGRSFGRRWRLLRRLVGRARR